MSAQLQDFSSLENRKLANQLIHDSLGIDLENIISLITEDAIRTNGRLSPELRSLLHIPNEVTMQAISEAEAGIGLKRFSNIEDLMADLYSDEEEDKD